MAAEIRVQQSRNCPEGHICGRFSARIMHVFLISAVPLSYIYALILRDEAGDDPALVGASVLRGMLGYLVELIVLLIIRRYVPRPYSGIGTFFYAALHDFGVPILGTLLLFLLFTPDVRGLSGRERRLGLLSFGAGVFTLSGIMDLFVHGGYFGLYELFLLPALRVVAVLIVPVLYLLFAEETFWIRGFYMAAIVALPFAMAAVFFLVILSMPGWAIIATAAMFAAAWLVTVLGARSAERWRSASR